MLALDFNNTTVNIANNSIKNTNNRPVSNSHRKYFLPRVHTTNYNILIDERNFYDQLIMIKSKNMMKLEKLQGSRRGLCYRMLDYQYFKDHYRLIAVDLSKQKELDADPRAIQPIEFYGVLMECHKYAQFLENQKKQF